MGILLAASENCASPSCHARPDFSDSQGCPCTPSLGPVQRRLRTRDTSPQAARHLSEHGAGGTCEVSGGSTRRQEEGGRGPAAGAAEERGAGCGLGEGRTGRRRAPGLSKRRDTIRRENKCSFCQSRRPLKPRCPHPSFTSLAWPRMATQRGQGTSREL